MAVEEDVVLLVLDLDGVEVDVEEVLELDEGGGIVLEEALEE